MDPMPSLSGAQIDKLGRRLRDEPRATEEDLALLAAVLTDHAHALGEVTDRLRDVGLHPTTRLKTSSTTIDKLRREPRLTLRGIDDLAGARIVRDMTLLEQDTVVAQITELWPAAKVVDRRVMPTHGYRAVHLVAKANGCRVEIQVRTRPQDAWAQVMEGVGDLWGRGVRYGLGPDHPEEVVTPNDSTTRRDLVQLLIDMSRKLAVVEAGANESGEFSVRVSQVAESLYAVAEAFRKLRTGRIER